MGKVQSTEGGIEFNTYSTNDWLGTNLWDSHLERVGLTEEGVGSITSSTSGGFVERFW